MNANAAKLSALPKDAQAVMKAMAPAVKPPGYSLDHFAGSANFEYHEATKSRTAKIWEQPVRDGGADGL